MAFDLKLFGNLKKFLLPTIFSVLVIFLLTIVILLFGHVTLALPYNSNKTKVSFNLHAFKQAMNFTGYEKMLLKPTVLVKISYDPPHVENLLRFQRTTQGPEVSTPSFGCDIYYPTFSKRLLVINLYVRGDEYLERVENVEQRHTYLNASTVSCLIDIFSPGSRGDDKKMEEIWNTYFKMQSESPAIFEFKTD